MEVQKRRHGGGFDIGLCLHRPTARGNLGSHVHTTAIAQPCARAFAANLPVRHDTLVMPHKQASVLTRVHTALAPTWKARCCRVCQGACTDVGHSQTPCEQAQASYVSTAALRHWHPAKVRCGIQGAQQSSRQVPVNGRQRALKSRGTAQLMAMCLLMKCVHHSSKESLQCLPTYSVQCEDRGAA
eukprot:1161932-Pelagomonas_calceolata.AAC.16